MNAIYKTEEGKILEVNKEEFNKGEKFFVDGLATTELQVLKSAAGYYIGTLSKEKMDDGQEFWGPCMRDSEYYWEIKEEAETALKTGKYPNKI